MTTYFVALTGRDGSHGWWGASGYSWDKSAVPFTDSDTHADSNGGNGIVVLTFSNTGEASASLACINTFCKRWMAPGNVRSTPCPLAFGGIVSGVIQVGPIPRAQWANVSAVDVSWHALQGNTAAEVRLIGLENGTYLNPANETMDQSWDALIAACSAARCARTNQFEYCTRELGAVRRPRSAQYVPVEQLPGRDGEGRVPVDGDQGGRGRAADRGMGVMNRRKPALLQM